MGSRNSVNRLRCLNCGSAVHWTAFQCSVCGRNPREREPIDGSQMREQNLRFPMMERRKHPRYEVQGKVILNKSFRGELLDLCQRGARLKTGLRLFHNEIVDLDFPVKGIPIHVRARVIHVKRGVIDESSILGVCFEAITRDDRELLNHHLDGVPEQDLRPRYCA